ncbi:hypothetical protein F7725_006466, partial [Dissostichus mawsoni]
MLVLQVFCSLIGWFCLYLLFCYTFAQRGAEWSCRLVTLSHGVIIVLLTGYVKPPDEVFTSNPPLRPAGTENTELQSVSLAVCLGYFFFDMCWCVCFHTEGPLMLAHHAGSIVGILLALLMGVSGCETCGAIFGSEITNPLLQTRWFLRQLGLYDSLLGDAVDLLFIVLFATVRVEWVTSPRPTLIMKLGGVAMYALAWVFMVDIARFCCKKSRAKYKKWQENSKLKEAQK